MSPPCLCLLVILLGSLVVPTSAHAARSRVCLDNSKDRVVVRSRCNAPRFTQLTSDLIGGGSSQGSYEVVNETDTLSSFNLGSSSNLVAYCPEGKVATGGGVSILDNDGLAIRRSIPRSALDGWSGGVESTKNGASGILSVWVVCTSGSVVSD